VSEVPAGPIKTPAAPALAGSGDVERNGAMAWIWNRILPKAMRAETTPSARIDGYVASKIRSGGPGLALAVVKAGAVVHAAGYGLADRRGNPITPDTIFHLASCGKQFTSLGMAMLVEEGKLHLDDPVAKHLPLLTAFGPRVTLRRLLHHTSGIRDLYDEDVLHVLASGTLEHLRRLCPSDFDPRRFRPNVYVDTGAEEDGFVEAEGFVEDGWLGGELEVGDDGGVRIVGMRPALRCAITIHPQDELRADPAILRTAARHHGAELLGSTDHAGAVGDPYDSGELFPLGCSERTETRCRFGGHRQT